MECPGSVGLIKALALPLSDEPEYRQAGTDGHTLLEWCLRSPGNVADAWEASDLTVNGKHPTVEMMDAVQVFLDTVRPAIARASQVMIEEHIDNPDFHPDFYGTVDCAVVYNNEGVVTLDVNDFKYGQGVVVEVYRNPQIMYYAFGILAKHPEVTLVRLRIIQPRAYHPDGPVRTWVVDASEIRTWAEEVLRPAMMTDSNALQPGPHCRFCPAKLVCPVMAALFEAAANADPAKVIALDDTALDVQYPLIAAAKLYLAALETETYARQVRGATFAHSKLVHKKANRVWNPEAVAALEAELPKDKLYEPAAFKSPAEVEKLGGVAKKLVAEYAFTPESGLTVAPIMDKRVAVRVSSSEESFAKFLPKD